MKEKPWAAKYCGDPSIMNHLGYIAATSPDAPLSPLLTLSETAAYLNTTERHIRRLRAESRIPFTKIGGKLRFKRRDLDAYIETQTSNTDPYYTTGVHQ